MFETSKELEPESDKRTTDYRGLWIALAIAPVFFIFIYFDKVELGFLVSIFLGMTVLAAVIRWNLRCYWWFWTILIVVLLLHVPLVLYVILPIGLRGKGNAVFAIPDLLITLGILQLATKVAGVKDGSDLER